MLRLPACESKLSSGSSIKPKHRSRIFVMNSEKQADHMCITKYSAKLYSIDQWKKFHISNRLLLVIEHASGFCV